MKAKLLIAIDLGDVGGHNLNTIEYNVEEILKHLPLKSLTEMSFRVDDKPVFVDVSVKIGGEESGDDQEVEYLDGDTHMLQSISKNLAGGYASEAELIQHLQEQGLVIDTLE